MRTSFFGIEVGRRALQAQQRGMEVTGHNIANANTPGYSRQEVRFAASRPYPVPSGGRPAQPGQIGTGVMETQLIRYRDAFLDRQFRNESTSLGYWSTRKGVLEQVDKIFNEPTREGIRVTLDRFWESLQELTNHPDEFANRATVIERATTLADQLAHTDRQLEDLQGNLVGTIETKVSELNGLGRQVADLNRQIAAALAVGDSPNDLRDRRDNLIDQISKMVGVRAVEGRSGYADLYIEGVAFVQGELVDEIQVNPMGASVELRWTSINAVAEISTGEIGALKGLIDDTLARYRTELSDLGLGLRDAINAKHIEGYDLNDAPGLNFLVGATLRDLEVNPAIAADPSKIAAAYKTVPTDPLSVGNGDNARRMADLRYEKLMAGGTATFNESFRSTIAAMGVEGQEAIRRADNQQLLTDSIDGQRLAMSGVSLDEEMTRMIQYQQAFNAAARLITAVDEMLETIINRVGVVGR